MSFRLGGTDGVSVEAAKWAWALGRLGFGVRLVAGSGTADALVPGLERGAGEPDRATLAAALDGADVVVVENLLSLPLNPAAWDAVAAALRGRPAVLRHHDLSWQRPQWAGRPVPPPQDRAWAHVTVNQASRRQLAAVGIEAVCCPNRFAAGDMAGGGRRRTREALGLEGPVVLHPVRAIPRKDVPAAVALAGALGATYWLTGAAEDGYGPELERVLAGARGPVVHRGVDRAADAYAAADAVVLTSLVEGFGNPVVESALARRPLALRRYPVAGELAAFGLRWFPADDPAPLAAFLAGPDEALLDHNEAVARREFGLDRLPGEVAGVLERVLP